MTGRAIGLAALACTAGLLAACGTAEQPDTAKPAANTAPASPPKKTEQKPPNERQVAAVIGTFHLAVDKGDGKRACAQLTSALQGVYATNPGASDCAAGVEYTHEQLDGAKMSALKVAADDVRVRGGEAVVSHRLIAKRNHTKASATDSYNLVRSDGRWKIDYVG
ncbi:MAG: hypothetical protein ACRDQB_03240 [Thermocrispum sp.]